MTSVFPDATLDRLRGVCWEETIDLLTPIEDRGGRLYKREDFYAPLGYGGINGAKLRQLIYLVNRYVAQGGRDGILTGASVLSPQLSMAALVGRHFGLPVTLVIGTTNPATSLARHENVAIAARAGAEFIFTRVGYNPAVQAKVAGLHDTVKFGGHYRLCYGITTPEPPDPYEVAAFHTVAARQTGNIPAGVKTIVMTAGSCNSCVSVLYGLALRPPPGLERVVLVGVGPTRLNWIEERLALIEQASGATVRSLFRRRYHQHPDLEHDHQTDGPWLLEHFDLHSTKYVTYRGRMPWREDGIDFHPTYEGKMLTWLHQAGDLVPWWPQSDGSVLVWIVGSAPSLAAMSGPLLLEGI